MLSHYYVHVYSIHVHVLLKYMRKTTLKLPSTYSEMGQVISLHNEIILVISFVVQICGIVLEIVQNGHNCTFFVVWEQRLKADVLKGNAAV